MVNYVELERKAFENNEKYWEYRRKWAENPKNHIVDNAPLQIDIELTNACNLKCPMCSRTIFIENGNTDFKQGFMSFGLYKKIIDEASELGVPAVKLIWRGEPTLHKELVECVKYAKDKGIDDVLINTNALLLTVELSLKLIKSGLDKIIFSLDSANEETYKKIRIGSDFNTVVGNIKLLKRLKEELGVVKPLTFASMIKTEQNCNEDDEFVSFFKDISDNIYVSNYTEQDKSKLDISRNTDSFKCEQIWQRLIIAWNGKVVPCCFDSELCYVLGDASADSIYNLWHGDKLSKLRQLHIDGKYNQIEICMMCAVATNSEI